MFLYSHLSTIFQNVSIFFLRFWAFWEMFEIQVRLFDNAQLCQFQQVFDKISINKKQYDVNNLKILYYK